MKRRYTKINISLVNIIYYKPWEHRVNFEHYAVRSNSEISELMSFQSFVFYKNLYNYK